MTDQVTDTELESTFSKFFGESEDTVGTGTATRMIKGELTEVVVDKVEHAEFLAGLRRGGRCS